MANAFKTELGLHFTLHMATQYTIPDLARLASLGQRHGFGRIWINENFGYRHTLLALTSIAMNSATNGVDLGVAITHPYVRNPLDAAAAFASLTEVMARQNLIVGLAIGDHFILGNSVHMLRPSQLVVEMARLLKELWKGETVRFADFPNISSLYRLKQDRSFKMSFKPCNAISLYCAGSVKLVSEASPYCDGIIIGGEFITLVEGGMLETHLEAIEQSRKRVTEVKPFKKMCEINVSVSRDRKAARQFASKYVCHGISRQPDALLQRLGIDIKQVEAVRAAFARGGTIHQVSELVTDDMIDAIFVAGTPEECIDRVALYLKEAANRRFDHVLMAKLGPDYEEAIKILGDEMLPSIARM